MSEFKLSVKEKIFVAAYIGSARRDATLAGLLAGCDGAAMMRRPNVKLLIERCSMQATVVDGRVIDLTHLPDGPIPRDRQAVAGSTLAAAARAAGYTDDELPLSAAAEGSPLPAEGGAATQTSTGPRKLAQGDQHGLAVNQFGETVGTVATEIARKLRLSKQRKVDHGKQLLRTNTPPADFASEELAAATIASTVDIRYPDPPGPDALRQDLADLDRQLGVRLPEDQDPGVPHVKARELVTGENLVYSTKVATPLEIKVFLSNMMNGWFTREPTPRLQAAALLGKAHGLFDQRMIAEAAREARENSKSAGSVREKLAEVRKKLAAAQVEPVESAEAAGDELAEDNQES